MKKFTIFDLRLPISTAQADRAPIPAAGKQQPKIQNFQCGAALVVTLCVLVLVTVLVLSLFLTVTSERTESAASSNQGDSQRLASSVVDLVKATISQATFGYESNADGTGTPIINSPTAWASQPGLIRTWKQDGTPYKSFRLYSSGNITVSNQADLVTDTTELTNWKSGNTSYNALWCDLNAPASNAAGGLTYPIVTPPSDTRSGSNATDSSYGVSTDDPATTTQEGVQGFSITSSPGYTSGNASATNNPAPMPVKWLYVLQNGSFVSPTGTGSTVTVSGATQNNPIIGRVAYWTDDETCKVNINTASEGVYWDKPYGWNREDSGLSGSPGTLGYSLSVPVQDEFQRLPGHPAFTSLSAVFGGSGWLPRPDIGFSSTGSNGAAAYTGGTYTDNILPYYNLSPRIGDGGTQGGTRAVLDLATAGNKVTLDSDRLYASSDEFLYSPTLGGGNRTTNNLNLPADQIRKSGFFVTATSKAPETTLFEQPRISLWPIQQSTRNVKDKLLAFASTTTNNSFPYYFQRVLEWASDDSPGSSQSSTADVTQGRNDALLKYLLNATQQKVPGFGAALSDKYKNGTLPQILVEMFDTVRSLVNTTSRALSPSYSYAPYGPSGSANNPVGLGSVVPARTTLGVKEVKGIGRFPTISEVVIVFMATGWADNTCLAPGNATTGPIIDWADDAYTPLYHTANATAKTALRRYPDYVPSWGDSKLTNLVTGSSGPTPIAYTPAYASSINATVLIPAPAGAKGDTLPDDVADNTGKYNGVGDPQTTAIRAFVLLIPANPVPGNPLTAPAVRYQIGGLDSLQVNSTSLGFPALNDAVLITRSNVSSSTQAEGGVENQLIFGGPPPTYQPWAPAYARSSGNCNGTTMSGASNDPNVQVFPFIGASIALPQQSG